MPQTQATVLNRAKAWTQETWFCPSSDTYSLAVTLEQSSLLSLDQYGTCVCEGIH